MSVTNAAAIAPLGMSGEPSGSANFFDFERATEYWTARRTGAEIDEVFEVCDAGPYTVWEQQSRHNPTMALSDLDQRTDKEAEEIKACYDLYLTYKVWKTVAQTRARAPGSAEWNKADESDNCCKWAAHFNLFTHSCNDLPDWRGEAAVKADRERLERERALSTGASN